MPASRERDPAPSGGPTPSTSAPNPLQRRIRVLLAEDQRLVRECVRRTLEKDPDIDVVAVATDGQEAVLEATTHRPDVVLLDFQMPRMDGPEAAQLIHERVPDARILMLSQYSSPQKVTDAVAAGIAGYLLKDISMSELQQVIRQVYRGDPIESPFLADTRLLDLRANVRHQFTERELDMLACLARGDSNAEIAERLYVSEQTVKRDLMDLFTKLDVENRTQAAVKIVEYGLAEGDPAPS